MKSIQSDLILIHDTVFGAKESVTNGERELRVRNTPSYPLVADFSVSKLKQLERIEEENKYIIHRKAKNKQFWLDINEHCIIGPVRKVLEKRERKTIKPNAELNVEKAKAYPITELLPIKGNTAKCIWHNEATGSLHYYPKTNTVYCFGACGKSHDVIDVYMQLNNCDFKTAVKALQ